MAGKLAINAGKGRKKVPIPPEQASFAAGSRPASFRSPAIPRVKPMGGQRMYGKAPTEPATGFGGLTRI